MNSLSRQAFFFYLPMFGISLVWDVLAVDSRYGSDFSNPDPTIVLHGVLAGLAIVILTQLASRFSVRIRAMEDVFAEILGGISWRSAFILAFLSALAEEYFFRGLVQHYLGWIAAGLLFGLVHLPLRKNLWPWTFFAVAVGLLFGYHMDRHGSLTAVTVAHFIINFINLGILGQKNRPNDGFLAAVYRKNLFQSRKT